MAPVYEAWYWNPVHREWLGVSRLSAYVFRKWGYCTARRKAL